ncbi:MAG: lipoate--protein ligase family protein [bacterium]|nr:lipoate--protein ligase family protein [bacterium]
MKLWDYSAVNPAENLAYDEALLLEAEAHINTGTGELLNGCLRFWESPEYFVVLGRSNKPETEVNLAACRSDQIPVLRRCSGGGTVVQGPGCLNYTLIQPINTPELKGIKSSNRTIMGWIRAALLKFDPTIDIQGHTDLTTDNIKFSGNAQRRLKHTILFHGTLLYGFDLDRVSDWLNMPSDQPEYRQNRPHSEFVTNIPVPAKKLKNALIDYFKIEEEITTPPHQTAQKLIREKYR